MRYKVPQLEPYVGKEELENLKKAIEKRWLDTSRAKGKFGFEARVDLREGLKQTID